jgi:DNA-binding PadR family transcriptional regulator
LSLKYAILGFLSLEPMSGYTLKTQYFDGSVAHFWPADQAQIYRTLQKLERDGEATSEEVAGDSRPARRVYSISESGLNALKAWLSVQHPPSAQRSTFLVQVYFSRLNSSKNFAALLNAERLRQETILQMTESIRLDPQKADTEELREQYEFGNLLIDYGKRRATMEIEWLEAVLDTVKRTRE